MARKFGLIGYPLSHSFSKKYFDEKFRKEGLIECEYANYELSSISDFQELLNMEHKELFGLNVTTPYKEQIIQYLDNLDDSARKVGAVNVIKFTSDNRKIGYNSDYYGFKSSLQNWLPRNGSIKALVLGSGGASKAVIAVLKDFNLSYQIVSRKKGVGLVDYGQTKEFKLLENYKLVINATPLGMYPQIDQAPDLPYQEITDQHLLYDLVYNPEETLFLQRGKARGAKIKNGLEMLFLQAEKSWEIWSTSNTPI